MMNTKYDDKIALTEDLVRGRTLLLSSYDESRSLVAGKGLEKDLGERFADFGKYWISESGVLVDCCTNFSIIDGSLSGVGEFRPFRYESETDEYKNGRSMYERMNDFFFSLFGLSIKGMKVPDKDPATWILPRNVLYTGNMDRFYSDELYRGVDLHVGIEALLEELGISHRRI